MTHFFKAGFMNKRYRILAAWGLLAVTFIAANAAAYTLFRTTKLDLTQEKLYTLSEGTKQILTTLKEPLHLKFFFSETVAANYPPLRLYAQRVRDLLREIAIKSDGKIKLDIIEPQPFSEQEDDAVSQGLKGLPLPSGEVMYFGLVGYNPVDGISTIPFFLQERETFLEYDIARMVDGLRRIDRPKVALISGLPLATGAGGLQAAMQGQSQPFSLYSEISSSFDIVQLDPKTDLDELDTKDFSAVMIVNPPFLSPNALYNIDQYVVRGGKLLAFVDPQSEMITMPDQFGVLSPKHSNLEELFKAWDITYTADQVIGDRASARRVKLPNSQETAAYLLWLDLKEGRLTRNDPITGRLRSLGIATAGSIEQGDKKSYTFEPLVKSSPESALIPVSRLENLKDPESLNSDFIPLQSYTIAARITGAFQSAFPNGKPSSGSSETPTNTTNNQSKAKEEKKALSPAKPFIIKAENPTSVIVFADSDLFDDRFWLQTQNVSGQLVAVPFSDNSNYVLNALDSLTGNQGLSYLRGQGIIARPFEKLEIIRRRAEEIYLKEEKMLDNRIEDAQKRLYTLQKETDPARMALSNEQQKAEIDLFTKDLISSRQALREVKKNLNNELGSMQEKIKMLNIGVIPLGLGLVVTSLLTFKKRKHIYKVKR
jgi:ABC-type uncharacterized transport system involved in gliding motility auxiliary subunit